MHFEKSVSHDNKLTSGYGSNALLNFFAALCGVTFDAIPIKSNRRKSQGEKVGL
jgi:hypothetical protein